MLSLSTIDTFRLIDNRLVGDEHSNAIRFTDVEMKLRAAALGIAATIILNLFTI